jgi:hypothetical protein
MGRMSCPDCGHSLFNHHADLSKGYEVCWSCWAKDKECPAVEGPGIVTRKLADVHVRW